MELCVFPLDSDLSSTDLSKTTKMSYASVSYLLGTLDLLQEGVQFPRLGIESATHSLVMVGGV